MQKLVLACLVIFLCSLDLCASQAGNLQQKSIAGQGEVTGTSRPEGKGKEIVTFCVGSEPGLPASYASLKEQDNIITAVCPFWYRLDREHPFTLELWGNEQELQLVNDFCRRREKKNYILVHNILYGSTRAGREMAHAALADVDNRRRLVENICNLVKESGYAGVCIDVENIYPADQVHYLSMLDELKQKGCTVLACVPAKTSDARNGGWGDSFDYAGVGAVADRVVIMAYDEHGAASRGGPVASVGWVDKVIRYALTKVPAEKIILGLPTYGFDWNLASGSARYLSHDLAESTARRYGCSVEWDGENCVPYYSYVDGDGARHLVYFENAASAAAKLELVNKYDLKGIALWRLGMEDPALWGIVEDKLVPPVRQS